MNLVKSLAPGKLPAGFQWLNEPEAWSVAEGVFRVTPSASTDLFRPPDGAEPRDNPCLLYTSVSGDFTATTHLKAHLVGFGDAGAITVRTSPTVWAKLCLERSPIGDVSIVSVVTRGVSDDSNGELLDAPECWLRLTRKGGLFGMHHSLDGSAWRFVRTFTIDAGDPVMVGIHAQAPFVGGCSVEFDHFSINPGAVGDFRSGE